MSLADNRSLKENQSVQPASFATHNHCINFQAGLLKRRYINSQNELITAYCNSLHEEKGFSIGYCFQSILFRLSADHCSSSLTSINTLPLSTSTNFCLYAFKSNCYLAISKHSQLKNAVDHLDSSTASLSLSLPVVSPRQLILLLLLLMLLLSLLEFLLLLLLLFLSLYFSSAHSLISFT